MVYRFNNKSRKVQMISLKSGKVLKTFESTVKAGEYMKDRNARVYINNCCLGKQKTALGYRWEYAD